jgi:hypothetical protein
MNLFLALLALALVIGISVRVTLFSSQRVRRMRWRIMFRLHPGPGFASYAELAIRWSRLAALHHGRRTRPSMRLHHRITARTTEYAIRLGRAQYLRRVFARAEDQTIILSLPRSGKSGMLADRVIDHPGAALVTESRPDIYSATAGYRARLGPIEVFNPENVSGIRSTSPRSPTPEAPSTCSPPAVTAPPAPLCSAASPPTCTAPPATTAWPSGTASSTRDYCSRSTSCTCAQLTYPPGSPTPPARASR